MLTTIAKVNRNITTYETRKLDLRKVCMLKFLARDKILGINVLTNNFTELDWFFSFNCYYLGCNYGKDITKQMFLDLDKVGYTYQVKGKSDINSCMRQCCSHETCNIAFFEGKVNIFCYLFFLAQISYYA